MSGASKGGWGGKFLIFFILETGEKAIKKLKKKKNLIQGRAKERFKLFSVCDMSFKFVQSDESKHAHCVGDPDL